MSIAYSGGPNIANNFFLSIGTTVDLADEIKARLVTTAGWTLISGSSGDWTIESAVTPEGLQCRVRIYAPGGGLSTRFRFQNLDGSLVGIDQFMAPSIILQYNLIANPYQFFLFVSSGAATPGTFVAGGVPKLEAALVNPITYGVQRYDVIWSQGNTDTDDRILLKNSFRNSGHSRDTGQAWNLINNVAWTSTIGAGGIAEGQGCQRLMTIAPAFVPPYFGSGSGVGAGYARTLWDDGTIEGKPMVIPARICWHEYNYAGAAQIQGTIWDAVVVTADFPDMQILPDFDGHDWMNVTDLIFEYANQALEGLFLMVS